MDLFAFIVIFICALGFLAVIALVVWARRNPAPTEESSDLEREWQAAIK